MSPDPADTGNAGENIGSINVTIGADYSSLETARKIVAERKARLAAEREALRRKREALRRKRDVS